MGVALLGVMVTDYKAHRVRQAAEQALAFASHTLPLHTISKCAKLNSFAKDKLWVIGL